MDKDSLDLYRATIRQKDLVYPSIYVDKNNVVGYSLIDERQGVNVEFNETSKARRVKLESTFDQQEDAKAVRDSLRLFAKDLDGDFEIAGPTDDELYVVVTKRGSPAIGQFGRNQEVIGLVFEPVVFKTNRANHGLVKVLIRERSK